MGWGRGNNLQVNLHATRYVMDVGDGDGWGGVGAITFMYVMDVGDGDGWGGVELTRRTLRHGCWRWGWVGRGGGNNLHVNLHTTRNQDICGVILSDKEWLY